ncbi:MAG: Fis family transcriptional regulator [Methanomicrobiales archaeon HGW-Methanomicrobiales-3]|nr:MAG: Fis family transcriptional regulator [Methanomicrobiales archaeon HGW-Methanomicrobiales-3]
MKAASGTAGGLPDQSPSFENGAILRETIAEIRSRFGDELAALSVERVVIGIFFCGVKLSNGHGGLCFTPIKEIPEAVCCPSSLRASPWTGKFRGRPVDDFLETVFDKSPIKRAIGIAVVNALSASCWDQDPPRDYSIERGSDALDTVEIPDEAEVVVVGALVPILKRLKERGKPYAVIEMDPRTLKQDELPFWVPVERTAEVVANADLLVVTGTSILFHSLEPILAAVKRGAQVVVVGPTASMLPGAFFRRGVSVLGGDLVYRPDELLDILSEGGSGYHFFGKSADRIIIRNDGTN